MTSATLRTITLTENDPGKRCPLSQQEQVLLARQNRFWQSSLGLSRRPFAYDDGKLSAREVTGFVTLGSLAVEVAPKFLSPSIEREEHWRKSLWAILARVYRAPVLGSPTPGQVTAANHLPDLLGMVLLGSLDATKPSGRPMGYITEQNRLAHLQGRLDTARIMDFLTHPGQVPCEYDVYAEDVPTNRLLRWASEQLSSQVRSVKLAHELSEEALALKTVSAIPPSLAEAERITLPTHHASLQPAVTVGQLLLVGRGLQHGSGSQDLFGFLWKSAEVFERFAWYLIQRVIRRRFVGLKIAGHRVRLANPIGQGTRALWTIPDVRLEGKGRTLAVLDAKYKIWHSQPNSSDVYQVVTGAWLRNCGVAGLIYPSPTGKPKGVIRWRLLGSGNPTDLWALFINLTEVGDSSRERDLEDSIASDLAPIVS